MIAYHMPMIMLKTMGNTEKLYDKLPALKIDTFIEEPWNKWGQKRNELYNC